MTSLSETFKLAFLGNIIKNKYVGKPQPVRLGRKEGDALMKQLVNEVFKKLLDEKEVITIELKQSYDKALRITTTFIRKFVQNEDVLFNRISLIRLISVCNLFLQDNTVNGSTLKRVRKKVDYRPDDTIVELLEDMRISSRGNQDVVEAIAKNGSRTVEVLTNVKTAFESEMNKVESGVRSAIEIASAERTKEAADLKEYLQRYIEEMKSQASSKRLKNVNDNDDSDGNNGNDDEKQLLKDLISDNTRKRQNQFKNKNLTIVFSEGEYIITQKDGGYYKLNANQFESLSPEDKKYLQEKLQVNSNDINKIEISLQQMYDDIESFIKNTKIVDFKVQNEYLTKVKKIQEQINKLEQFGKKLKEKVQKWRKKQLEVDEAAKAKFYELQKAAEVDEAAKANLDELQKAAEEEINETNLFDEYSDDFEAASSSMSIDETHFLKVIFNTLKNPGVDHVTNSLIDYLESGLQMNKGEYKRSYKQFYNTWQFEDDVVMESDKDVVKTLFSNINEIDFDDDYLCIMGGDTKLSWISYMRIAVYEKYRLMDLIENFNGYDIRGCMREALSNFIYDYCYMSTLMFETDAE